MKESWADRLVVSFPFQRAIGHTFPSSLYWCGHLIALLEKGNESQADRSPRDYAYYHFLFYFILINCNSFFIFNFIFNNSSELNKIKKKETINNKIIIKNKRKRQIKKKKRKGFRT